MSFEHERLSEIIGSIYDCVILPDKWPEVHRLITSEFRLANAILTVHDTTSLTLKSYVEIDIDPEMATAQASYAREMLDLWGGPRILNEAVLEEPVVQSDATPPSTWKSNGWCRDICETARTSRCRLHSPRSQIPRPRRDYIRATRATRRIRRRGNRRPETDRPSTAASGDHKPIDRTEFGGLLDVLRGAG